jgi:hypothetical protein
MFLLPTVMNSRASTININPVSNTTNQHKDKDMNMNFLMKEIAIQKKERDEQSKLKQVEDRINNALKNTRKDKKALLRRRAEISEMDELIKSLKKSQRSDAGINKELRSKVALEFAYVDPRSSQTISDEEAIKKKTEELNWEKHGTYIPHKRPKKTFQEFMAQEIPKSENSTDKQIVDIKDILNNS